ncbi:MAG: LmeA family phospholipid-binding protein [Candidatus Obscuribacterales bacterium]|nr:LmeA family phospholipid-binding protein [Candidatus Obscuribacterales bacterium]
MTTVCKLFHSLQMPPDQARRHILWLVLLAMLFVQPALCSDEQVSTPGAPAATANSSSALEGIVKASQSPESSIQVIQVKPAPGAATATGVLLLQNKNKPVPFALGSSFSRNIQKVTGVNFITGIMAGVIAQSVLHHKLGGKIKVSVKTYSLTDLIAGKVKSVSIQSHGCHLHGVPLGDFSAHSNDPIWFDYRKGGAHAYGLNNPVTLAVKAELNQKHVCRALAAEAVIKSMRGLKLDLPGLGETQLQVLNPKVTMSQGLINIHALLVTEGASADTGIDLEISATPKLVGSKIMLENMHVTCPDIEDPQTFSKFAEDLFNPVVDFGRFDRSNFAFRLTSFELAHDKIIGDGCLLLVPKATTKTANASKSVK